VDGIFRGHNLLLSQASFFTMKFRLSRSLSYELFLFSRWNSGYHEALHTNFSSFFTIELWLSRSPSHEFFFFFHDGILAITKPFTRIFLLFSRWNSGYHKAFLTNFFLFSRWNSGYHKAFLTNFFLFSQWNSGYYKAFLTNFSSFSRWNSRDTQFGGRLFSYIYHKEYLHRIRLVKNLAS
jgi:hypothetical protein